MTEARARRLVFQAFSPTSTTPGGQQPRPLLDFLQSRGLLPAQPQAMVKTPVLDIWRSGYRPVRELVASTAFGLSQLPPSRADEDKLKREEGAKAPGENFSEQEIEELKRAEAEAFKRIAEARKKADLERIQNQRDFALIM